MTYNAQLKAWALDRAIETVKAFGYDKMSEQYEVYGYELVEFFANKFCEFTAVEAEATAEEFPEAANAQAA